MTFTHKLAARLARLKDPVAIVAALAVATIVVSCEHPVTDLGSIIAQLVVSPQTVTLQQNQAEDFLAVDRKSTRLNSSHGYISYAVFCLKKKKKSTSLSLRFRKISRIQTLTC